ncbi:MAG TPA: hypothetical protein PKD09_17845 [Aggregatilinea sp.]|uniref:WD40/YVTN/BNR-like repeat-containing protein n=1 Tax=Aggregatilinea sp. TaxID=2806333 RepID=UPI002C9664EE|nr:hypothetical protein [Aggregatilinea sp.]HML23524.1 hypothetical protein [Aggregatilinea sp.]
MLPDFSPTDLVTLRQFPQPVTRHLSVAPRPSVFQTQVTSVFTDGTSLGVTVLGYLAALSGDPDDILPGYTAEFGTTQGARDIGSARVRISTPNFIQIAETAPSLLPVEVGHYITIRAEHPIQQRLAYMQSDVNSSGYEDDFEILRDYNIAYTDQHLLFPPICNIEGKPSGWCEPGQTYRLVTLDASASQPVATGASITAYSWEIGDCTLESGYAATDAQIVLRAPAGFRWVSCTVTDSNSKTAVRYVPVWAHHPISYPPATYGALDVGFTIARDERYEWREMDLRFFGVDEAFNEAVIAENALICYWEEADFGGDTPPVGYIDQFLGWTVREATFIRLSHGYYFVTVAGAGYFLDGIGGLAGTLQQADTPASWSQMEGLTIDRAVYAALRYGSTALDVCNLYVSDQDDPRGELDISPGSLWSQVRNLVARYAGLAGCDSLNGILLRRDASHLSSADRTARGTLLDLTADDWTDETAWTYSRELRRPVGRIIAEGRAWAGSAEVRYKSQAPGATPDYGVSESTMPLLSLPYTGAQEELNRLVGDELAWQQSSIKELPVLLMGNLDVVEPAWRIPVTLTVAATNPRGLALSAAPFVVTRVSVQHSVTRGEPDKRITWSVSAVTQGRPGQYRKVEVQSPLLPYSGTNNFPGYNRNNPTPPAVDDPLAYNPNMLAFCDDGKLYRTEEFPVSPSDPVPSDWAGTSLGLSGTILKTVVDARSPKYLGTGDDVNGWVLTTTGVYRIDAANGTPAATLQYTLGATAHTGDGDGSISEAGFVAFAVYYGGEAGHTGTWIVVTTDGVNWDEVNVTPHYVTGSSDRVFPTVFVDSRSAGHIYAGGLTATAGLGGVNGDLFRSVDYGQTWAAAPQATNFGDADGGGLEIPWHDNANRNIVYWSRRISGENSLWRTESDGVTMTNITPPGNDYGVRWGRYCIATCPVDRQAVIVVAQREPNDLRRVFVSSTGGDDWTPITAEMDRDDGYLFVTIGGEDPNLLYLWGSGSRIGVAFDGETIIDCRGNLSTGGRIIGIWGG